MKKLSLLFLLLLAAALSGCSLLAGLPEPGIAAPDPSPVLAINAPADPGRQEALEYFREIAFGSEYGVADSRVRKWARPIMAAIHGEPTNEDMVTLQMVMDSLNTVPGFPGISLVSEKANMDIHFVPLAGMDRAVPGYVEGNWGFFTVRFGKDGIVEATVAIAIDVTDQQARNHLLFEEVVQSTGLMKDSDRYDDSIFYGRWTTVQQPTALDWELVRMLYLPELTLGMGMEDAMGALETGYRQAPSDTGCLAKRNTA